MVKRSGGGESLALDVYARLRADIFDRKLAPGERLAPAELAARSGVSPGVVREALGLLAAQQLVQWQRNRGYNVTTLSPKTLADLIEARKVNEGAALRLSITHGEVAWESEILAAHHRLASVPHANPDDPGRRNPEWAVRHVQFHHALIGACGNPILLDICDRLSDAAELYRAWAGLHHESTHRNVEEEHRKLMEAALAHDADLAVALFEAHVERTRSIVLEHEVPGTSETATG
jgi:DNA-binding GntR family transcriptional regulator